MAVRSVKTGKLLGSMLLQTCSPKSGSNGRSPHIVAATLTAEKTDKHQILLVSCSHGYVYEYSVLDIVVYPLGTLHHMADNGRLLPQAPFFGPRRVWKLPQDSKTEHLVIDHLKVLSHGANSTVIFALAASSVTTNTAEPVPLLRLDLPPFTEPSTMPILMSDIKTVVPNIRSHCIDSEARSTIPLDLLVAGEEESPWLIVVTPVTLLVFRHDHLVTVIDAPGRNLFSVAAHNDKDMACGHLSGAIRIYTDFWPRLEQYFVEWQQHYQPSSGTDRTKKPKSLLKQLVVRKLHWHAHPVQTLAYDTSTAAESAMLYSGGAESVVATWQVGRGTTKPVQVLPRVSVGEIHHLLLANRGAKDNSQQLLVYCSDNSLQLFDAHNQHCQWKIQGIAAVGPKSNAPLAHPTVKLLSSGNDEGEDDSNRQLLLSGLSHAPGQIQVYSLTSQQVTNSVTVVPFNRVSRTDPGDEPLPLPSVDSMTVSDNNTIVTIDTAPTENAYVGAAQTRESGRTIGTVTSLKFFDRDTTGQFQLSAVMTAPHGNNNLVSSSAVSPDGQRACSVSNDDRSFCLWTKRTKSSSDYKDQAKKLSSWMGQYKVEFPSGYANFSVGDNAVAFSLDSSVLAIAFGPLITLWNIDGDLSLIRSIRHLGCNSSGAVSSFGCPVDSLQFIDTKQYKDLLLSTSAHGIVVQSPFGAAAGPEKCAWEWSLPANTPARVVASCYCHNIVAAVVYDQDTHQSRILTVDAVTGKLGPAGLDCSERLIAEKIVSITATVTTYTSLPIVSNGDLAKTIYTFYVLSDTGRIFTFSSPDDTEVDSSEPQLTRVATDVNVSASSNIPTLSNHLDDEAVTPGRRISVIAVSDLIEQPSKRKRLSLHNFGSYEGEVSGSSLSTALPSLHGNFLRAFVGRNLS